MTDDTFTNLKIGAQCTNWTAGGGCAGCPGPISASCFSRSRTFAKPLPHCLLTLRLPCKYFEIRYLERGWQSWRSYINHVFGWRKLIREPGLQHEPWNNHPFLGFLNKKAASPRAERHPQIMDDHPKE